MASAEPSAFGDAARLAEIGAGGELAQDQHVEAGNQLFLEAGRFRQRRQHGGRAQVGEQVHFLAQLQQARLRADVAGHVVPFGAADGAQQHRVDVHRLIERVIGQGRARRIDGGAADQVFGHVEGDVTACVHPVDDAANLAHHLGTDAVARQEQQFLVGGH